MKTEKIHYEVAVIGAGVAGLVAAQELKRAGCSVVILEARDRIGGRIHTKRDFVEIPINLGAELIHAQPTRALSQQLGLEVHRARDVLVFDKGSWQQVENTVNLEEIEWPDVKVEDEPLEAYLERAGFPREHWPYEFRLLEVDSEPLSRWSTQAVMERAGSQDEPQIFGEQRILGGHDQLLKAFTAGLEIRLNTIVTTVEWNDKGVHLHLRDKTYVSAEYVVLTLPLAILKARHVGFLPDLPTEKWKAIDALGVVDVVKLFYLFPQLVMPEGVSGLMTENHLPTFWWSGSAGYEDVAGELLVGWAAGEAAKRLITLGSEKALRTGLESLRAVVGKPDLEPTAAILHHWGNDPFALGAYTFTPPGAVDARDILARPTGNRLFWAGEATDTKFYGYVDGALESGKRVAKELLHQIQRVASHS